MTPKPHGEIVAFYEACLQQYGDTYQGVGWTRSAEQVDRRYQIMLDVIKDTSAKVTLLDFGCGASHLYEYVRRRGLDFIDHSGLDVSRRFLELSKSKFPTNTYYEVDVRDGGWQLPPFDYVVLNGVFTVKRGLTGEAMFEYAKAVISRIFPYARAGLAFNVMSKHVDWERDDLFHIEMDRMGSFLTREVSRHFVIRHDYGLYEYTIYVYRQASESVAA
jgi:Methyltransferase small domain